MLPSAYKQFIQFTLTLVLLATGVASRASDRARCEPVQVDMCRGMTWNMTSMPNHLNQSPQENVQLAIEQYRPLVETQCSSDLLFFLCSLFTPFCTQEFDQPLLPCRDVCQRVKQGCESVIVNSFNRSWPQGLNCDEFPVFAEGVCITPQAFIESNEPESQRTPDRTDLEERTHEADDCNCKKKAKLRMTKYVRNLYDYSIRARVKSIHPITERNSLVMVLAIRRVINDRSDLGLQKNSTLMLWTYGTPCGAHCKLVKPKKEYLFVCDKDIINQRIMFDINNCMVARWSNGVKFRIKSWDRLSKLPPQTQTMELERLRRTRSKDVSIVRPPGSRRVRHYTRPGE